MKFIKFIHIHIRTINGLKSDGCKWLVVVYDRSL